LYTAVILVKVTQFSKDAWCSDSKEITTFRQRVFVAFVKQVKNVRPTDRQTDKRFAYAALCWLEAKCWLQWLALRSSEEFTLRLH